MFPSSRLSVEYASTGMAILVIAALSPLHAGDWNEWRGSQRNGVVTKSPALLDAWPEGGPKKLWDSADKISGSDHGGYGSVVVVDGRVFVFQTPKHQEPLTTRTLDERNLKFLGWQAKMPPKKLLDLVEKARLSDERTALKNRKEIQTWAKKWTNDNLKKEQQKPFGRFVSGRLTAGTTAIDVPVLEKLAKIKGKEFADQKALDEWFAANGIEGDLRKRIAAKFPSKRTAGSDVVICLDAATGKTLWKAKFPGVARGHASSSTPCVINGKCYVIGSDGDAYCLNAKTGEKAWQQKIGTGEKNSSFIVADGVAIIPAGPLTGLDAETGKVLWSHETYKNSNASPVLWTHGEKRYVIARAGRALVCLDPKPGTVAWTIKNPSHGHHAGSSPAIEGDIMAVSASSSVALYKLSPEKATQQANVKCPMDYSNCPIIVDGHVYVFGRKGSACISLADSKVVWSDKDLKGSAYIAPVFADKKVYVQGTAGKGYGDGSLFMMSVSPEKGELLSKAKLGQILCTTPAIANGLLYTRNRKGISCYDLRK